MQIWIVHGPIQPVPVARVIGSLASGMTPEDVCQDYDIEEADLRAALQYAAELKQSDLVERLPGKLAIVEAGRVRLRGSERPGNVPSENG